MWLRLTLRKDGYTSLLIQEEGGDAEVVVSEENGILISMMLRQYFMALKVLDRWHLWGPSMDQHWGKVISGVASSHPNMEPSSSHRRDSVAVGSPDTDDHGWENWTAARIRDRRSSVTPLKDDLEESAPEVGDRDVKKVDSELRIMRKVFRKWCRIAKVHAACGENLKEEEFTIGWTKAIAPRLEGRIEMVTG